MSCDSVQVNFVLDEICAAGMVLETNIVQILQAVNEQEKLHKKSEAIAIDVQGAMSKLGGSDTGGARKF